MENYEINDYPPANSIKQNEEINYPIIRCEECYSIPILNIKLDKKEIKFLPSLDAAHSRRRIEPFRKDPQASDQIPHSTGFESK